jgi:hypothetical protein
MHECLSARVYRCHMGEKVVRWNIKVSKETDLTLRTFLGSQGMKKGDFSEFIEAAVRWRVFHRRVEDIEARNADTDQEELQRALLTMPCARCARKSAPRGRPTKPDARGARYQHSGFFPFGSTGAPSRDLVRLAGRQFYASGLRRAARRIASPAAIKKFEPSDSRLAGREVCEAAAFVVS